MIRTIIAMIMVVSVSACVITPRQIPARLYKSSGEVLSAEFIWNGGLIGKVMVTKTDELCTGEYSTAPSGTISTSTGIMSTRTGSGWGRIFSLGAATSTTQTYNKAQQGIAVAVCPSGEMLECEYVAGINPSYQGKGDPNLLVGSGSCKSNKSSDTYRLMFSGGGAK